MRGGVDIILQPGVTGDCSGNRSREQSTVWILCGTHIRGAEEGPGQAGKELAQPLAQALAWLGLQGLQRGSAEGTGLSSTGAALGHEGEPLETQLGTALGHWPCSGARLSRTVLGLNSSGLCLEHGWEQGEEESCSCLVDRDHFSCF